MAGGHQGCATNGGARHSRDWSYVSPLLRNFPQESDRIYCVTQVPVGIGVDLFVNLVAQIFRGFFVSVTPDVHEIIDLNDPDFVVPVYIHSSAVIAKQEGLWTTHLEVNSLNTSSTISHRSRPSLMLSKASCFNRGTSY